MNKEILISSLWMQNNFQYDPLEMPVMSREGFAKAAEVIRNQTLEDAAAIFDKDAAEFEQLAKLHDASKDFEWAAEDREHAENARENAAAIRALKRN